MTEVGIKAISCALPSYLLPRKEFAKGRGIDEKRLEYLGIEGQAVPKENERIEDLMAKSIVELFENFDVNPEGIHSLLIATEELKGKGYNIANEVISLVKKKGYNLEKVNSFTSQAACNPLPSLIEQGISYSSLTNEEVLVVAGDRSLYEEYSEGSPGEETQGMGACAFLIGKDPKVATLDKHSGCVSILCLDWFRPEDNEFYPVYDSNLSVTTYLYATFMSQKNFKKEHKINSLIEYVGDGAIVPHRPVELLPKYAFALRYGYENDEKIKKDIDTAMSNTKKLLDALEEGWREILNSKTPTKKYREYIEKNRENIVRQTRELKGIIKEVSKIEGFKEAYNKLVYPAMKWQGKIGNTYTTSVGFGILSALNEKDLEEKNVIITSYGSGMNSTTVGLKILNDYKDYIAKLDKKINKMEPISFEEYLELRN